MAHGILIVNLNQIKFNINAIKKTLPESTKIVLVAKANAYGLGAVPICKFLDTTIDMIGVATIDEAIELRTHGIVTPILLLSEPNISDFPHLNANNIIATVYTPSTITHLDNYTKTHHTSIKTHLKIDTGMTRLGTPWNDIASTLDVWMSTGEGVIKDGMYSHLANSDSPHALNAIQHQRFSTLAQPNITNHLLNSEGIQRLPHAHLDAVRIGLSAYQNSVTLQAPILNIQRVPPGTPVGYGSTHITTNDCIIATIGMGYADGLSTQLSNQGHVVISNEIAPIVGRICMDMFMVSLPKTTGINRNATATILAPKTTTKPPHPMTLNKMADITHQNPREIMTRFSHRVRRIYLKNNPNSNQNLPVAL
jgi:alanine racemase